MTTKIEITDEMVERGWKAVQGMFPDKRAIRDALTAALTIPAEPEIAVTEAMKRAALYEIELQEYEPPGRTKPTNPEKQFLVRLHDVLCCYRAMEKARRKEAGANLWGRDQAIHTRHEPDRVGRMSIYKTLCTRTANRRKDDPK